MGGGAVFEADAAVNRAVWTKANAEYTYGRALANWRESFGLARNEWPDDGGVTSTTPADAESRPSDDFVDPAWARQWPSEEIWRARKR